jgi:hypothetical protein
MSSKRDKNIREKLGLLKASTLGDLARKNSVKGFTKKKKAELIDKLVPHWDKIRREYEGLATQKRTEQEAAVKQRTAKAKVTKKMKSWAASLTKGKGVDLCLDMHCNHHMNDGGEPTWDVKILPAKGEVVEVGTTPGKVDFVTVRLTDATFPKGMNCKVRLPLLAETTRLVFHPSEKKFYISDEFTTPTFKANGLRLVTPYDDDPVYSVRSTSTRYIVQSTEIFAKPKEEWDSEMEDEEEMPGLDD